MCLLCLLCLLWFLPSSFGFPNVYISVQGSHLEVGAEGLDTLLLWPSPRAIPFYERAGFAPATGAMEMSLDE